MGEAAPARRFARVASPLAAFALLASAAGLALAACGCSAATGSVTGGEPLFDAGVSGDVDAGVVTFTELYASFFGPTGKASCAGDGACHGAADQPGAQATASTAYPSGYVCAPDQARCYAAMTGAGLTATGGGGGAEQSTLYTILRKTGGGGSMPKRPTTVAFSPTEMARIRAWIAAGAKND